MPFMAQLVPHLPLVFLLFIEPQHQLFNLIQQLLLFLQKKKKKRERERMVWTCGAALTMEAT
jgi:hypothetical protein